MGYEHTQHGKLQWLLWGAAIVCLVGAFLVWSRNAPPDASGRDVHTMEWAGWLCLACAGICGALVFSFSSLTVRDEGDRLAVCFGPWPFWTRRIPYASIRDPRPARSKLIDGWGIHWFPGRGWTWNVWTFDCVEMTVDGRPFRIGTDDKEALAAFLQSRVPAA
jgi:hypothetical protein